MSDLLSQFEQDCVLANVPPTAALKAGGVHPTLWKKWKDGKASPTLRNFELARSGLKSLVEHRRAEAAATRAQGEVAA
jgi:hypothetical protein